MKINILFVITEDMACAGGNQFLKALRNYFVSQAVYTENVDNADVVIFNSFQNIEEVARIKRKYKNKIFIQRIDGPARLYNAANDRRDFIANNANRFIADATVFQSKWSREANYRLGLAQNHFETVIMNAPDHLIFNRKDKKPFSLDRKIRLIATSWSSNWNKGFKVYQWLDEHLNSAVYEMVFIGNSPVKFANIRLVPPLPSKELALYLKESDIFITASQKEACSNSLIEAMHCGLPALVLNDGGNLEIIGKGGLGFRQAEGIPALLNEIINNYLKYQKGICLPEINEIGKMYYEFIITIHETVRQGEYIIKKLSMLKYLMVLKEMASFKLINYLIVIKRFTKRCWSNYKVCLSRNEKYK